MASDSVSSSMISVLGVGDVEYCRCTRESVDESSEERVVLNDGFLCFLV